MSKPAYIVVDDAPEGIRPLLNKFMESPEYPMSCTLAESGGIGYL